MDPRSKPDQVNCNIGWLQISILLGSIKVKQLDSEEKLTEKVNNKLTSKLDYKPTEKLTGKHLFDHWRFKTYFRVYIGR